MQRRATYTFRQLDGRTLHMRKATVAETELKKIYDALGVSASPGGIKKLIVDTIYENVVPLVNSRPIKYCIY